MGEEPIQAPEADSLSSPEHHGSPQAFPLMVASSRAGDDTAPGKALASAAATSDARAKTFDGAKSFDSDASSVSKARAWLIGNGSDGSNSGGSRPTSAGSFKVRRKSSMDITQSPDGSFDYSRLEASRMMSPTGSLTSLPKGSFRDKRIGAIPGMGSDKIAHSPSLLTKALIRNAEKTTHVSPHSRTSDNPHDSQERLAPPGGSPGGSSPSNIGPVVRESKMEQKSLGSLGLVLNELKREGDPSDGNKLSPTLATAAPRAASPLSPLMAPMSPTQANRRSGSKSPRSNRGSPRFMAPLPPPLLGAAMLQSEWIGGKPMSPTMSAKSPKVGKDDALAPPKIYGSSRRRTSTVVRDKNDSMMWPGSGGNQTLVGGLNSARSGASARDGKSPAGSARGSGSPMTAEGGKAKGPAPDPKASLPSVTGSRRRSSAMGVPGMGASSVMTAKQKAKEAEEKEKAKVAEREKQNAQRRAREEKDKDLAALKVRKKSREDALIRFEETRKKDISDHGGFRERALQLADHASWSLLYEACRQGNADKVRALVDPPKAAYLHRNDKTRERPISVDLRHVDWAAEELGGGSGNDARTWLTEACHVNAAGGKMARTALHAACSSGRADVVQILCQEFGAKIDLPDAAGRPPIWDAAKHGHLEVVQFLVDAGAKVDTPDMAGNTATHMAVRNGHSIVVQVLVDAGADLLCQNKEGKMAKEMSSAGSKLSMYLKSLGELQAETMKPKEDLQLHIDGLQRRDHPDPVHRIRLGHSMYVRSAFFVCERHIESGEYLIKRTYDGFRTNEIAHGPLPAVSAIGAAQSGLVLVALSDGRILRTQDDFETVEFALPGVAHGGGQPLPGADKMSHGAPLQYLRVVDSNIAYAVGDAPPKELPSERMRALRAKAHAAYQALDTDMSNLVDHKDMTDLAKLLDIEMTKSQAQDLVEKHDDEGSGKVDLECFFEWYKEEEMKTEEQPQPLLLRTRNGGHSFERVGIPSEAMRIFSGEDVNLIGVGFGGKNNSTGVVLARYGKGQSLLLVSQDGGNYWACIEPQRWYESERERIEKEKVEAARAVARDLHMARAIERKEREEAAKKRLEDEEVTGVPDFDSPTGKEGTKLPEIGKKGDTKQPGSARSTTSSTSSRRLSRQGSELVSKAADGSSSSRSKDSARGGSTSARQDGSVGSLSSRGDKSGDGKLSSRRESKKDETQSGGTSARSSKAPSRSLSRQGSTKAVSDKDSEGDKDNFDASALFSVKTELPHLKRQSSGRLKSPKSIQDVQEGEFMVLPSIALGKEGAKKDDRIVQKEAQLQALLEAKKKARDEEEMARKEADREAAAAAKLKKEQEQETLSQKSDETASSKSENASRTSSAASEQDETVMEIAGRLSRLQRDGSKAVLEIGVFAPDDDDSDDDDNFEEEEKRLSEVLGDDKMDLKALSSDEDDEEGSSTGWWARDKPEIKGVRPDWIPQLDVEGLAEKYLDHDDSEEEEEEEPEEEPKPDQVESEEEEEGLASARSGSFASLSRQSSKRIMMGGSMLSMLSSARSSVMGSRRNLMSSRMESSRDSLASSRSGDVSGRFLGIGGILTNRGYMSNNFTDQYQDDVLQEYANMPEEDFKVMLESKPEADREALKLAVAIVKGLQEDPSSPPTSHKNPGSPTAKSPLGTQRSEASAAGAETGLSSPLTSGISSPQGAISAVESPPRSQLGSPPGLKGGASASPLSAISLSTGSQSNSPLSSLSSLGAKASTSSFKQAGKKSVTRMATGRNFTPAPVKEKYTGMADMSQPGSAISSTGSSASGPGSLSRQSSSKSVGSTSSKSNKELDSGKKESLKKGDSSSKLSKSGSSKKMTGSSKNLSRQESQNPVVLRGLREFTFDKELELKRKMLQRDLESAEGEERLSTIDLREAILNQKVEGIQGGPLTAKKIAANKRVVAAREATLTMIETIKTVCERSVKHLTEVRDREAASLKETLAKITAKEDEKTKLPKRGGDEARKRKDEIEKELEDFEHDKTYFSTNVGYVEEAIEEELNLKTEMLHGRPLVDTWGSRGLDSFAGVVAGGFWLTCVAVVSDGAILVAGAGGVQRSTDGGRTWKCTFALSAEVDCTHIQAVNSRVFALVEGCIHRSDDGGIEWEKIGKLPPHQVAVRSLFCFIDEEHGFAGNERGNIYFTCDGGKTWEQRTSVTANMRFVPGTLSGLGRVPP